MENYKLKKGFSQIAMPFLKIYIHLVWSTKDRIPLLKTPEIRKNVWQHILANGRDKGIFIDQVNGYSDHCHCLVSLGNDQTIQKTVQLIKGESSFWINKEGIIKEKFAWQNDYFAVSVSESLVPKVRVYIQNQEAHHQKKTFQQEYDEFINKFGFEIESYDGN